MSCICLNGISKSFGAKTVLKTQDACFTAGSIYGIVGYNGCGKTVLLKCICGLLRPDTGCIDVKIDGQDVPPRPVCGVVIDGAGFFESCNGVKNLTMLADVAGKADKKHILKLLQTVGLDPTERKKVKHYSLGMRQRLSIAQALMEDPPVLLLDEPLNGLDYQGMKDMYRILHEQKQRGKIILVASHHEEDIRLLCDQVYWLKDGLLQKIEDVQGYTMYDIKRAQAQ